LIFLYIHSQSETQLTELESIFPLKYPISRSLLLTKVDIKVSPVAEIDSNSKVPVWKSKQFLSGKLHEYRRKENMKILIYMHANVLIIISLK
jgi:hypothetical protein